MGVLSYAPHEPRSWQDLDVSSEFRMDLKFCRLCKNLDDHYHAVKLEEGTVDGRTLEIRFSFLNPAVAEQFEAANKEFV